MAVNPVLNHPSNENTVETVDLRMLFADIQTEIGQSLAPEIQLDVKLASSLPLAACCRERLRDAIVQLLSNARDALPAGGIIGLSAAARHHRDGVSSLDLHVSDNGIGMEGTMLRRALEPFFTTKTTGLGGLGLTIVSHFAREVGGKFHLESEFEIGTRATLSLPAFV
ncbi:ATP-binding protein [Rhizobium sp. Root1220]|uniref:ATP-binding protein n=1 Tax=Rhizobium sp. Root1220 TaxID=1736432 RepID=UPI0006F42271|nr:ATP-binding protein [Rhizobium sp. Root1220]KQV73277.1 hypothetical protein ASC90_07735 [Rhizobium sp. Root1220]